MNYRVNAGEYFSVPSSSGSVTKVSVSDVLSAVEETHRIFEHFIDFEIDVFAILGMRNLSAFVGEVFAKSFAKCSDGKFVSNPHQDGYPDLLLLDSDGIKLWQSLELRQREKGPFSPFANGGLEVKATVGAVPTPKQCAKIGKVKPELGDQRIALLRSYDWKAHHRETNNLMGLTWDFLNGIPQITAVFYSCELEEEDWSAIVKPKAGGGRTTSVSIMTRGGVRKMYDGWLVVIDDEEYTGFFNRYNKGNRL